MANTELQFEMAMRDQVIHNQREALRNLWNLLMGLGLDERRISDLAAKQGITIEDWTGMPNLGLADRKQLPNLATGRFASFGYNPYTGQLYSTTSCNFQHYQDFSLSELPTGHSVPSSTFCREEHHSSYYLLSHDHSSSACLMLSKMSELGSRPSSWCGTLTKHPQHLQHSYPEITDHSFPYGESCMSSSSLSDDFGNQNKVCMLSISLVDLLPGVYHAAVLQKLKRYP